MAQDRQLTIKLFKRAAVVISEKQQEIKRHEELRKRWILKLIQGTHPWVQIGRDVWINNGTKCATLVDVEIFENEINTGVHYIVRRKKANGTWYKNTTIVPWVHDFNGNPSPWIIDDILNAEVPNG